MRFLDKLHRSCANGNIVPCLPVRSFIENENVRQEYEKYLRSRSQNYRIDQLNHWAWTKIGWMMVIKQEEHKYYYGDNGIPSDYNKHLRKF